MGARTNINCYFDGPETYDTLFYYTNNFDVNTNTSSFTIAFWIQAFEPVLHPGKTPHYGEGNFTGYITVDGQREEINRYAKIIPNHENEIIFNLTFTLKYTESYKNVPIDFSLNGPAGTEFENTRAYYKGTINLGNGFEGYPKIYFVNSGTDEVGSKFEITYPEDRSVIEEMAAGISFSPTEMVADIGWKVFDKSLDVYQMEITPADTEIIDRHMVGESNIQVNYILRSKINGLYYYSSQYNRMRIANAPPEIKPDIIDTNPDTVNLTGDSKKLIRFMSSAKVVSNARALKYSTIVKETVRNGDKLLQSGRGTFYNVSSPKFEFYAVDARNFNNKVIIDAPMIEYVNLTCNGNARAALNPSNSIDLHININGNYFNDSFGKVRNTLEVKYRYKASNGVWSQWETITPTISNNHYTTNKVIPELPGNVNYVVQGMATDIPTGTVYSTENVISTKPIFDWGDQDFNFNVPVSLSDNKISNVAAPEADTDAVNRAYLEGRLKTKAPAGYGLGDNWGLTIKITDVDNTVANGFYRTSESYIDAKGRKYGGITLLVCSWNSHYSTQLMFTVSGGFYMRQRYNNVWKDWILIKDIYR